MAATFSMYNKDHDEFMDDTPKYTFGKKDKAPVDENAPKKPLTAFMAYCNKHRAKVQKKLGDGAKVGAVQKELGEMWKACAGKAERTKLEEAAKADKAKYDKIFGAYKLSGNYREHQEKLHAFKIHQTTLPFRKDENYPKRALSAYMLYCNEHRDEVMKRFKGKPITETMKELSKNWNGLGDKGKAKWNKKAAKAKEDRVKEVEKYEKSKQHKQYLKEKKEFEEEMAAKRAKLVKQGAPKRKLPEAAPAPPAKKAKKAKKEEPKKKKAPSSKKKKDAGKKGAKKPSKSRSRSRSASKRRASSKKAKSKAKK